MSIQNIIIFLILLPLFSPTVLSETGDDLITIYVDIMRSEYSDGLDILGFDIGVAYISSIKFYYCPSYIGRLFKRIDGDYFSFTKILIVDTSNFNVEPVSEIIVNGTHVIVREIQVDYEEVHRIDGRWYIEHESSFEYGEKTDTISIYDENGMVLGMVVYNKELMILSSYNINISFKKSVFESTSVFMTLRDASIEKKYADLLIESETEIIYVSFNDKNLYITRLNLLSGEYTLDIHNYSSSVMGIWSNGRILYVYLSDSTDFIDIGSSNIIGVYTIFGVFKPLEREEDIQYSDIPKIPVLPRIPSPPEWYNFPAWITYTRDRVVDFFTKILPNVLSLIQYLVKLVSQIWGLLGVAATVLSIIFLGLPAVIGVYSMILLIHGEFHEISRIWLYYVEFIRKVIVLVYRVFKGIISIIVKIASLIVPT